MSEHDPAAEYLRRLLDMDPSPKLRRDIDEVAREFGIALDGRESREAGA